MPDDEGNVKADEEVLPDTSLHRHHNDPDGKEDEGVENEDERPER